MNAAEIYKAALVELAGKGSEMAALALIVGGQAENQEPTQASNQAIIAELKDANEKLHEATTAIHDGWYPSSLVYIKQAQSRLMNAVAML